ncbi:hypothetical protein QBC39DRAFT_252634 [Podospora conica]|nr:hypothetical protein QBC39DRAFT_252634 [Schizothecium conicum]
MGASASKAAQNGARKFPTRAPGSAPPSSAMRSAPRAPNSRSNPQASYTKDEAIRADSTDPSTSEAMGAAFAQRLKEMGVAQPNPIYSHSSTAPMFPSSSAGSRFPNAPRNNTLNVLDSRRRLQAQADEELNNMGKPNGQGREFLDMPTIQKIISLRQQGKEATAIEARLGLKSGVVARLGSPGIVSPA